MTPEQRARAGAAVAERIREMNATVAAVARAAQVTPGTLRGLIAAKHWPTDAVQSRIEAVLRWHEGEIVTRAVQGGADGTLDLLTDAELAVELARRLTARSVREAHLRSTDT